MSSTPPSASPAPAPGPGPNPYRAARAEHAAKLRSLGVEPFGLPWQPTHTVQQARALCPALVEAKVEGEGAVQPKGPEVRLAGRIGNLRTAGTKLLFATLFDRSRADAWLAQRAAGTPDLDAPDAKKLRGIQLFCERSALGDAVWEQLKQLDLADWVGVTGLVGRTKTGEVSVFVKELTVLGKALLPPPHQAGAGSEQLSPEIRARQRYLDLATSDASLATFMLRSRLVSELRRFFDGRDFLEVETPILHTVLGGAAARPFTTHHNTLDLDLYLRIAPELHLKRLIVGGMERVYEVGRNFRNEGISARHNPEFTMVEFYQAYADHIAMMSLAEDLLRHLADKVLGTRRLRFGSVDLDLSQPFARISYHEAMQRFGGPAFGDVDGVRAKARELGIALDAHPTHERLANAVWEEVVEPHLQQPTFITDQPTWLTPLCKTHPNDPSRTLRFELFIAGMEFGNAYSELNDPDVQRQRFAEQLAEATATGDEEAGVAGGVVDDDYCVALDHGLPVCGGMGIGIDRLVRLFTDQSTIQQVILFPTMRPEG